MDRLLRPKEKALIAWVRKLGNAETAEPLVVHDLPEADVLGVERLSDLSPIEKRFLKAIEQLCYPPLKLTVRNGRVVKFSWLEKTFAGPVWHLEVLSERG